MYVIQLKCVLVCLMQKSITVRHMQVVKLDKYGSNFNMKTAHNPIIQ